MVTVFYACAWGQRVLCSGGIYPEGRLGMLDDEQRRAAARPLGSPNKFCPYLDYHLAPLRDYGRAGVCDTRGLGKSQEVSRPTSFHRRDAPQLLAAGAGLGPSQHASDGDIFSADQISSLFPGTTES